MIKKCMEKNRLGSFFIADDSDGCIEKSVAITVGIIRVDSTHFSDKVVSRTCALPEMHIHHFALAPPSPLSLSLPLANPPPNPRPRLAPPTPIRAEVIWHEVQLIQYLRLRRHFLELGPADAGVGAQAVRRQD